MTATYSQMHRTDKYSQQSGCGFKTRYNRLNFRYRACFGQGVP